MSGEITGADLRAWRNAHCWSAATIGALFGVGPGIVRYWERDQRPGIRTTGAIDRRSRRHAYLAYVAAHPAPPVDPTYPPTPAGLAAAITRWPTRRAWATWWGVRYVSLWRWLTGQMGLPRDVQAWLRAGAPGRERTTDAPPAPPPIGSPGSGWVRLHGQWAPPANYCDPERDALQLAGCARCCYAVECADLRAQREAAS